MNMDILNFGIYDIIYKGQKIQYDWKMYQDHEQIWLTYNGETTVLNLREDVYNWDNLCLLICNMADSLNKAEFEIFQKHLNNFISINDNQIVIDNNIYAPEYNKDYDWLMIETTNGDFIINKDNKGNEENKYCFNNKIKNYCTDKQTLPEDKYILEKETLELKTALEWFEKNRINLDTIYKK